MADDVVSTVRLEGVSKTESDFATVAKAGEEAMARVSAATKPANKSIDEVGQKIGAAAQQFNSALRSFGSAASGFGSAAGSFVGNVGRMAASAAGFAAKMGIGIAIIQKLSGAQEDNAGETKEAIALHKAEGQGLFEAQERAVKAARAIQDLNQQYARGKISMGDYLDQKLEFNKQQKREEEDAKRLARERQREASDKQWEATLKKRAEAQKTYNEAVKAYGADTVSGLSQAGTAWDSFMAKWNQGPSVIGDILRGLSQMLQTNGQEIVDTLNKMGDAFSKLFGGKGGDRAKTFGESFMAVFRGVAAVITSVLIPAIGLIVKAFEPVAWIINKVFGTQVTAGVVAGAAAIVVYAGGLKLLATAFGLVYRGIIVVNAGIALLRVALIALGAGAWANPIIIILAAVAAAILLLIIYWDDVKRVAVAAGQTISAAWTAVTNKFNSDMQRIKDEWNAAVKWIVDTWNQGIQMLKDGWQAVQNFFTWDNMVAMASAAWEKIKQIAAAAWEAMKQAAADTMVAVIKYVMDAVPGLKTLVEWITKAVAAFKAMTAEAPAPAAGAAGKKRGGLISGPGTSTSDSVPLWGSVGEYMMRTKAVQYYGRSFMAAINSMRLPRDFDFSSGLVIPAPRAAFATGGEVTRGDGGRPVILQFPDGQSFALTAANETADRLGRYAISRRVASAGRKPTYYGGA